MKGELTILTYGKSLSIPIVAAIALLPLKRPSISKNNGKHIKKHKTGEKTFYLPPGPSRRQVTSGLPLLTLTCSTSSIAL